MKLADLQQHRMVNLAQLTMSEWFADNTPRHAAALAYYTIFALSPLLTIVFSIAGAIYGFDVAQSSIVGLVEYYVPNAGVTELIQIVLSNSIDTPSNPFLTVISVGVLIYGATSVFGELRGALNLIWDAPEKPEFRMWDIFRNKLFALLMVFLGGLVLFAALIITTIIADANQWAVAHLQVEIYSSWVVFFSLLGISTVIFALIYKFVPDVEIAWHDVLIGAVVTALLFTIARTLINFSLNRNSISSIYGATGSLVILLAWTYYSSLIFFLGAEFTQVYSRTYGSRRQERVLLEAADTALATPSAVVLQTGTVEPSTPASKNAESMQVEMIVTAQNETLQGTQPHPQPPQDEALQDKVSGDDTIQDESVQDEVIAEEELQNETSELTSMGNTLRHRWQQGMRQVQLRARALSKLPGKVTSPIGDIAIGVAVVGAISVAGLLFEPWRRKQK